jgi:DNA invertase Pin-like site-specific DNA recombinase
MTVIGYVFLDSERDTFVPMAEQQRLLEEYMAEMGRCCEELLVEESFSASTAFHERSEGKKIIENIEEGDLVVVVRVQWLFGDARSALVLIDMLREVGASLHCIDLGGDIVNEAERKLTVSRGVAPLVQILCKALSQGTTGGNHSAAIRAGKAKQKKEGKYLGGPVPFGFQVGNDSCLEEDAGQQEIIQEMLALKADRWSYRAIAEKMDSQYGLHLSHEGIRKIILKNK